MNNRIASASLVLVSLLLWGCDPAGTSPSTNAAITVQPTDQTVVEGRKAQFKVTANIYTAKYQWQVDMGRGFEDLGPLSGDFGDNGEVYQTPPTTLAMNGTHYRVILVGGNHDTVTSQTVLLTVTAAVSPPVITTQPMNQKVTAPQPATFSVVAIGSAPLKYQWQRRTVVAGAVFTDLTGDSGATFTIAATTLGDTAEIRVVVTNAFGSVTSSPATLSVGAQPNNDWFYITTQPVDTSVKEGNVAAFSVIAYRHIYWDTTGLNLFGQPAGVIDPLHYTWQVDTGTGFPPIDPRPSALAAQASTYHTPTATMAMNGYRYRVIVWFTMPKLSVPESPDTFARYQVISNEVRLTVVSAGPPLAITTQPASQQVTAPQPATFSVVATGVPPLHYQWQRSAAGASFVNIDSATNATFTTGATTEGETGTRYRVVVSDMRGVLNGNPATLTVTAAPAAPTLTTQPADITVTVGQPATFTVVANGVPTPTYQWRRRSSATGAFTEIAGATGTTLTLATTAHSDSGAQYVVAVTNSVATVTSNPAILTVTPQTMPLLAGFQDVCASNTNQGDTYTLAIKDGVVWSWGGNDHGQLGRSGGGDIVPGRVQGLTGTFVKVFAKNYTAFALRDDGSVWAWGRNDYGQLGNDAIPIDGQSSTPVQVKQNSDGSPLMGIADLAMGGPGTVVAWNTAGAAWAWGSTYMAPNQKTPFVSGTNFRRAVAIDTFDGSTPKRSIKKMVIGGNLGLIILKDGTLSHYGLPDGSGLINLYTYPNVTGTVLDVATNGDGYGYLVLSNQSVMNCTGYLATALPALPFPVDRIVTGEGLGLVFAHDPTANNWKAWGPNDNGDLGNGTVGGGATAPADAVPVLIVNDAVKITASGGGTAMVIAIRPDGGLWGWGLRNYLDGTGTGNTGTPFQLTTPPIQP